MGRVVPATVRAHGAGMTTCNHTVDGPRSSRDPARAGAIWVTGTGAFLLLAAAAVFVAVRWDDIPAAAKPGAVALLTGGFLHAGRALRSKLPATASVLFHLGAFLVPVDVAAVGVRAGLTWDRMLLAQGVAATVTFAIAARSERSVVLGWAAWASVLVLAGGVGAVAPVPAPLVLAVLAVAGAALGLRRAPAGWAAVAGLAPALAAAESLAFTGSGTLARLGFTGHQPRLTAVITGLLAAAVLAVQARRDDDVGLALGAAGVGALGLATTWTGFRPGGTTTLAGIAGGFLAVEAAALLLRRDRFWSVPAGLIAQVAEVPALVAAVATVGVVAAAPLATQPSHRTPAAALAASFAALGWIAADLRRREDDSTPLTTAVLAGAGWAPATVPLAASIVAAVVLAFANPVASAAAMLGVAALLVASGRPLSAPSAAALACWAPVTAYWFDPAGAWSGEPHPSPAWSPFAGAVAGVVGSAIVAWAAVIRGALADRLRARPMPSFVTDPTAPKAWALAVLSLGPVAVGAGLLRYGVDLGATLVAVAIVLAGLAAFLDLGGRAGGPARLGTVARLSHIGVLVAASWLDPAGLAIVAAAVTVLVAADAARLDEPALGYLAAAAATVAMAAASFAVGLDDGGTGVALCIAAVVLAGLAAVVPARWRDPFVAGIGLTAGAGGALAAARAATFADALLLLGGLAVAAGVVARRPALGFAGGAAAIAGIWVHLALTDVAATEAYVAPVAALLLVAGVLSRRNGAGSWTAYAPAVALLGGSALVERMAGGGAGHALIAGAVGVAAVLAGGQRRLSGPLVLGTALLVALTGYESLAVTAGVPTWAWLAGAGTLLLAAGVAMERADTGPVETGRRLVDTMRDRFE